MLKFTTLLALSLIALSSVFSQDIISEKDLIGNWKMTIETDGIIEKIKKETSSEENLFARVILKSVSGIVDGVLDNVDIYFKFRKGGDVSVTVQALGETSEEESSKWTIKNNKLFIDDPDKDNLDWDNDDPWVMKDGVLVLKEEDEEIIVYMVKID